MKSLEIGRDGDVSTKNSGGYPPNMFFGGGEGETHGSFEVTEVSMGILRIFDLFVFFLDY